MVKHLLALSAALMLWATPIPAQQPAPSRYLDASGRVRVALVKQPLIPNGASVGPSTMAGGGVQEQLTKLGAVVRVGRSRSPPTRRKIRRLEAIGVWRSDTWVARWRPTSVTGISRSACWAHVPRCRAWSRAFNIQVPRPTR